MGGGRLNHILYHYYVRVLLCCEQSEEAEVLMNFTFEAVFSLSKYLQWEKEAKVYVIQLVTVMKMNKNLLFIEKKKQHAILHGVTNEHIKQIHSLLSLNVAGL